MFFRERTDCDGVLIVHLDKTTTCTNLDCPAPDVFEHMVDAHMKFVGCTNAFDFADCPHCGPTGI